ncbi:MAG: DNA polymerase I, partial [Planctomycetaceae bacterium]
MYSNDTLICAPSQCGPLGQGLPTSCRKGGTMAKTPRLFLIDGSALAYRSYFAFIRNPLINSKGENTSAVFGFTRTMLDILTQENPEYIAVAFDTPEPTFRHQRFVDYKATRQKMPDEMSTQLPRLKEVTEALGVTLIELPGFEADDVMGTLAKRAERGGLETYLVTADKDLMQLVSPCVKIYSLRKVGNQQEILDPAGVQQKFGVPPERVIDVLALMGDSSDNIPGVRGIGEKTAVKLIQDYGDLETILAKVAEVKPKGVAEKILANVEMARLSQELATIHTDVPLPYSPTDLVPRPRDAERLTALFQDLEFGSLVRQVAAHSQADHQGYQLIRSRAQFDALCTTLQALERFAIDTETTDLNPLNAELLCVSVAWAPGEAYCVPRQLPEHSQPDDGDYVFRRLQPILENPAILKCGQNIKYDMLVLSRHGIELQGVEFDTMVASYVVNP